MPTVKPLDVELLTEAFSTNRLVVTLEEHSVLGGFGGSIAEWRCEYADGKAVGFIGAMFSARPLLGRLEKFCNPSSWIVLEEHRYASALLLKPR